MCLTRRPMHPGARLSTPTLSATPTLGPGAPGIPAMGETDHGHVGSTSAARHTALVLPSRFQVSLVIARAQKALLML